MEYDEPLFFRVLQYAAAADRDVVRLVSGNPDWEPPGALREGLREYADAPPEAFQYPPSDGLRALREEIAARRGVDVDRVVVTNGAGEANYLAMARAFEAADVGTRARTEPGSAGDGTATGDGESTSTPTPTTPEVLLTDPVYPYYPGKTRLLGGEPRLVPVEHDGQPDVAAFREAAGSETVAIVVNTPNNPTGAVYEHERVAALAEIAAEHDALLVVDEVYDHFDYTGAFESALSLGAADERVVVTAGFSKSLAITGFRVGYAVFPPDLVDRARTRHMLVNVTGARPSQVAVLRALRETPPDYYESTRETLRERIDAFCDALAAAGADYTRPDGAFYVLARFDGFPGTLENVKRLVDEAGVAAMPGEAFGPSRDDWLRFALVSPRAEEAAGRLADYFG
jgi:aspartate/methionine/tyrosine aminotransferase